MKGTFFQLPLSGSHHARLSVEGCCRHKSDFQLPLSGSPTSILHTLRLPAIPETFNSLSRDHPNPTRNPDQPTDPNFQLPLSGSRGKATRGGFMLAILCFQLPLSGSRQPDPLGSSLLPIIILSTPSLGITKWRPRNIMTTMSPA